MSRALAGRHRLWFFSVALPMWFSQGCLYVPHLFRGAPIEFRVVDDTTGAPLPNVVVTANWQLVRLNVAHAVEDGQLVILETVSDADGRVRFSGWGPRLVRPLTTIGMNDPQLVLFAEGYRPAAVHNGFRDYTANFTRHSDWNGDTIRLKRPKDERDYVASLQFLGTSLLQFALPGDYCEWRAIPTMLSRALAEGEKHPYTLPDEPSFWREGQLDNLTALSKCGSIRDYLRRHQHED